MAIPILPLLAVLAAVAVSSGKKKKKEPPIQATMVPLDSPPYDPMAAGEPCGPGGGPSEIFAAYNDLGQCVEFWNPETKQMFHDEVLAVWDERGQPEVCDPDTFYEHRGEWVPDPWRIDIMREALSRIYEMPKDTWPTYYVDHNDAEQLDMPYWVAVTWQLAHAEMLWALCGFRFET